MEHIWIVSVEYLGDNGSHPVYAYSSFEDAMAHIEARVNDMSQWKRTGEGSGIVFDESLENVDGFSIRQMYLHDEPDLPDE